MNAPFRLDTHKDYDEKTHIYSVQRTGQKDIYAVGTYKGLFILKIDLDNFEITQLNKYFNDPSIKQKWIRAVSYVNDHYLLLSINEDP
jgi:hypothetical protein